MPPRDLSNSLLDDRLLRPCLSERAHVHEVRPGEAAEVGEHLAQVMGQALDALPAPPSAGLSALPRTGASARAATWKPPPGNRPLPVRLLAVDGVLPRCWRPWYRR